MGLVGNGGPSGSKWGSWGSAFGTAFPLAPNAAGGNYACRRQDRSRFSAARFCSAEQNCRRATRPNRSLSARPTSPPREARSRPWTRPSPDLSQAASGSLDRLRARDPTPDVKKNWATRWQIHNFRCCQKLLLEGKAAIFLSYVGVPRRRRQALAKPGFCGQQFRQETRTYNGG